MGKMKELTMSNEKEVSELTRELVKDTKELAKEQLTEEVDEQSIMKVVKAIFVGVFEAIKKAY